MTGCLRSFRRLLRLQHLETRDLPAGLFTEFTLPANSNPTSITAGPDGNMWFTSKGTNKVGRITMTGTLTEFTVGSQPGKIISGPDGNLWFTEAGANKIGRMTPAGTLTEFPVPTTASGLTDITLGPDGNLWFTENVGNKIGRITPTGTITEFSTGISLRSGLHSITTGSDGNLYFTAQTANKFGRITPAGAVTETSAETGANPTLIIAAKSTGLGPKILFEEPGVNKFGRFGAGEFPTASSFSHVAIGTGLGGFTQLESRFVWATAANSNEIVRFNVDSINPAGNFAIPTAKSGASGIAVGPDQNIWFTESSANKIGRLNRAMFAVGADSGGPHVKVFDADGTLRREFFAYDASFRGGVRVATGDVNSDGIEDLVTVPGPGGGPHLKTYDGATGVLQYEFFAYDPSFSGGLYVAASLSGGIVTGAGAGGGPHVKRFTSSSATVFTEFYAYAATFAGGVRVALGDVDGDGRDEIITGPGAGGGPHVKVFSVTPNITLQREFYAYDASFAAGVFVAAGDLDGDGKAEVITGAGPGGGPHVKAFSGANNSVLASYFAYDAGFTGGVRVAAAAVGGTRMDILTTPGSGTPTQLRARGRDLTQYLDFPAYDPAFNGGCWVG